MNSRASAGAKCGRVHALAWKCATDAWTLRVTSPRGSPFESRKAPSFSAPGMAFMVARASVSISWMMSFARLRSVSGHDSISVRMSRVLHPTRLYISAKSWLGTVSVPSMSKITPRSVRLSIGSPGGSAAWALATMLRVIRTDVDVTLLVACPTCREER